LALLKVPLFINFKERFLFFSLLIFIAFLNLFFEYQNYKNLISKKYYETTASILHQYKKKNRYVLKLRSAEGFVFYTTSKEDLKDLTGRSVEILLIKSKYKLNFLDFLKNFYYVSYIKKVLPKFSVKEKLAKTFFSNHKNTKIKELYGAIFLSKPISKELREKLSFLGISHLIAISGFHFGLIFIFLFFIFKTIYTPLQQKFFPYRNGYFDITILVLVLCLLYAVFLGEVASVWRAYFMIIVGFFLLYRHIEIFSFETLFWVVLLILSIFPKFIFSIGFWLSVSGVFYIYLFLHYFSYLKKWQIFLLLNFWIFIAMVPIVHYFFENFSYYQLFSPFITMAFTVFYPLSLIFHLFGYGDIFDSLIEILLSLEYERLFFKTPFWFLIFYIFLSIASIYKKRIFYLLIFVSFIFFIYNIAKFQTV